MGGTIQVAAKVYTIRAIWKQFGLASLRGCADNGQASEYLNIIEIGFSAPYDLKRCLPLTGESDVLLSIRQAWRMA